VEPRLRRGWEPRNGEERSFDAGISDSSQAWEPDNWPEGSVKAYILRNVNDPDEVIAFGFFEGEIASLRNQPDFRDQQEARFERMAPHVESTGADGVYEVVEEVSPS
jgi:hypothetical protein